jgi:DNA-binding NarL/FixJ family response regulator
LSSIDTTPDKLPVSYNRESPVLTAREQEIVGLASSGLSNKQIGRKLNVAEGTVKIHLHNVYGKLDVPNPTALAAYVLRYSR